MSENKDYSKIKAKKEESPRTEEPKVKKIKQTGSPSKKKQSLSKRLLTEISGDSNRSGIGSYILSEIVVPAAKDVLLNAITSGAKMLIFGGEPPKATGSTYAQSTYKPRTNYSNSYRATSSNRDYQKKSIFDSSIYIFDSRDEAQNTLDQLLDLIDTYGQASISDFCECIGEATTYTDNTYGWYNLNNARVVVSPQSGYYLNLPRPIVFQ